MSFFWEKNIVEHQKIKTNYKKETFQVNDFSTFPCMLMKGFPSGTVIKNPPANAGDLGSIPGLGRSPGGGNGNPF